MPPFNRETLDPCSRAVLTLGRWANADIYSYTCCGAKWVIKDFLPCHPVVRETWGRYIVHREYRVLRKLEGIHGVPSEPFLLDEYALCYRFIPGKNLREISAEQVNKVFFVALEQLVSAIHGRNLVHLDIRNQRNILMAEDGTPVLLDFQSSLHLEKIPVYLRKLLKDIDFSGVYKAWSRKSPETLDAARMSLLKSMNRIRPLWFFKGYPLGTRKGRRTQGPRLPG